MDMLSTRGRMSSVLQVLLIDVAQNTWSFMNWVSLGDRRNHTDADNPSDTNN